MIGAAVLFSIMGAFVKASRDVPIWEVAFFRAFINVLYFLPWALTHPVWPEFKKEPFYLLLRGFAGFASVVMYFYAIQHISLADGTMLNHASPVLVLVLSWWFLGERLSKKALFYVVLAFLGVLLVLKPGFRINNLAGFLGVCSAFTAAIAYVAVKKATRKVSPEYIVFTFAVVGTLASAIPAYRSFIMPTALQGVYLLGVGIFATLAQIAMTRGYSLLPASVAAPMLLITVVFSTLWGWLFWGELPDALSALGAVCVAVGLTLAYRHRTR